MMLMHADASPRPRVVTSRGCAVSVSRAEVPVPGWWLAVFSGECGECGGGGIVYITLSSRVAPVFRDAPGGYIYTCHMAWIYI